MKRSFIIKILFFTVFHVKMTAQIGFHIVNSARSAAMGNATSAISGNHAVFQNPAALINVTQPSAIIATAIPYGIKGLNPIGIGVVKPTNSGVFGLSIQHLGFDALKQQTIGLAFTKRFTDKISVGIQFDYIHLKSIDYGNLNELILEIACNTLINSKLNINYYVYNPLSFRQKAAERTPSVFCISAAYTVNEKVVIDVEIEKNVLYHLPVRIGFEYFIFPSTAVRCGFSTQPTRFSIGFGHEFSKNIVIDMALTSSPTLGLTPFLSVNYAFNKVSDKANK